jgi:hypothetical protein
MVHSAWCLRHRESHVVASLKFMSQPVLGKQLYDLLCRRDARYAALRQRHNKIPRGE